MELPDEDTIRILITTDNHVGYNESDPVTGDDSWKTFHEIMMLAKSNNVDMILQSGDLFHTNKPSKKSLYQVMKSLRLACMSDRPCELELLSDPAQAIHCNEFSNINYEDPNFNISIPVFGISGNHDDATGDALLCPMDILHVSGLLNHYGKVLESDNITITPLLFQKGNTKLALYGLASVRDERLFRTFKEGGVKFELPTVRESEWFNLMCVHQNHTGHTNTAFLPEQFLPEFLDLVIWGHEHECIPNLVHNPIKKFDVLQPGSSVATSLCDAEAQSKYVFILEIKDKEPLKLSKIPLKSIRTFKMKSISLEDIDYLRPHDKEGISKYLITEVEKMIEEANQETKEKLGDSYQEDVDEMLAELPLPLIRLRVNYSASYKKGESTLDYQVENPRRFSNRFVGRVANTNNVVQFYKKKRVTTQSNKNSAGELGFNEADVQRAINANGGELKVDTLISDLLDKMKLSLLPEVGMNDAVKKFVNKDEKAALKEFINKEIKNEVTILSSNKDFLDNENIDDFKTLVKEVKRANTISVSSPFDDVSEATKPSEEATPDHNSPMNIDDEDVNILDSDTEKTTNNLRRKKTETSKKPTTKGRIGKKPTSDSIIIQEEDDDDDIIICDDDDDDEMNYGFTLSDRDPPEPPKTSTNRKRTLSQRKTKSTPSKPTRNKEKSATQTPKTDALSQLLARKRR